MPYFCAIHPVSYTTYVIPNALCISSFSFTPTFPGRMLNAYPPPSAPPPQNIPIISGGGPWWVNVRNGYVSSPQTITNQYSDFPPNHSLPRDNNLSLILSHYPRKGPSPFTYTIRHQEIYVALITTASFFLWVSPRSEDGYFSRDKKVGSGWPADRRGNDRIGSQGCQSAGDK